MLFFGPVLIPNDCKPSTALCDFIGYLFATTTLLSPICAVVMAVDRAAAVYFHVWYKNHPYVKVGLTWIGLFCIVTCLYSDDVNAKVCGLLLARANA